VIWLIATSKTGIMVMSNCGTNILCGCWLF
jgi:hypothetical protein